MKDIGKLAGHVADASKALGNSKDFVIYDYLSFVYRRHVNDEKWENNLSILKGQEKEIGKKLFNLYINEAKEIALNINVQLREPKIDLSIPKI